MKISDVSRLAQISASTLRVWEEKGFITPTYSENGTRYYSESDVETALRIKRMRAVNRMSISAIREAIDNGTPAVKLEEQGTDAPQIGSSLRALRLAKRLKIKDAAASVGIDPSTLASLERTSMGIDIPLLQKLARYYGATLNEVMGVDEAASGDETVMRGRGVVLPRLGAGLRIERLGSGKDVMDCQRWSIEPGVHSNGSYRHEGEEFLIVIRGQFEVTIENDRVHVLSSGDSMYFRSDLNHGWRNPGADTCELIWICVGNSF
jgi:DNA-binding transcriptional MerR regulator/quercetin dioxygenase-like cupin family protein